MDVSLRSWLSRSALGLNLSLQLFPAVEKFTASDEEPVVSSEQEPVIASDKVESSSEGPSQRTSQEEDLPVDSSEDVEGRESLSLQDSSHVAKALAYLAAFNPKTVSRVRILWTLMMASYFQDGKQTS